MATCASSIEHALAHDAVPWWGDYLNKMEYQQLETMN
jgi:hypothetical protein